MRWGSGWRSVADPAARTTWYSTQWETVKAREAAVQITYYKGGGLTGTPPSYGVDSVLPQGAVKKLRIEWPWMPKWQEHYLLRGRVGQGVLRAYKRLIFANGQKTHTLRWPRRKACRTEITATADALTVAPASEACASISVLQHPSRPTSANTYTLYSVALNTVSKALLAQLRKEKITQHH